MDKSDITADDPPAAFDRFKQALQHILSVSKDELKRREEAYKRMRKAKRRKTRQTAVAHPG